MHKKYLHEKDLRQQISLCTLLFWLTSAMFESPLEERSFGKQKWEQ